MKTHRPNTAGTSSTAECRRLEETRRRTAHWRRWGPYLADRQWGTVREDYSPHGTAWDAFPHDHARSRAYRWGEDGIAGICDNHGRLCFALALWNGRDAILKRSEEHTSELQSRVDISYAVFCLKKKKA